jgi:hypothetical protein
MLSKVRYLLKVESDHDADTRKQQQWQLLFTVDEGVQYVIGKGGVNTMFYQIGTNERVLCYPEELLTMLEKLAVAKYTSYGICSSDGTLVRSGITDLVLARKKKAPIGSYIVGFSNGAKVKLFKRKKTLFKEEWVKLVEKP